MSRFKAPYPGNENTKNTEWSQAAPRGMRSPDHLWGEYWQRFNMFRIPIFDKVEYFRTAVALAKDSKSKEDFERKFEEVNERRLQELQSLLSKMFWNFNNIEKGPPHRAAHIETSDARTLRCLEHFIRILNDYVFDQEADTGPTKIVVEKQNYTEENSLNEGGEIFVEDETETLIREISRSPSADPEYEEYLRTGRVPDEWSSQLNPDVDWTYEFNKEHKSGRVHHRESDTFTRTNFDCLTSTSDDTDPHTLNSDDDILSIQQVPSLTSNDSQDFEEANETTATKDGLRRRSSISSKSGSSNSAKKRVRFSDDDEDVSIHEPKRRKLETTLANAPNSPTPQSSSGIKQASHGGVSRKRSRPDDDEEDNGYKRQKIESVPRSTSPILHDSCTEDESASRLAQGTSEKVPEEHAPESNNGRRKQQKQKSTLQTSRAKSPQNAPNTRSSRRAKSSTLWELDSSGKSRSI
ncbi:hypothetical protein GGI43DRAFT_317096 [Trichoderma evansii]